MSHFTGIVIGANIEKQLAPYDENIQVPKYKRGEVSEEDKQSMLSYYQRNHNFSGTIEECYERYGDDWNSNSWEYDENGVLCDYTTYNPKSKWDWYSVGGRWSGFFKVKPNGKGIIGEPGAFGNEAPEGTADQLRKCHIDFEGMRNDAVKEAEKMYDLVHDAIGHTPVNEDWTSVRTRITNIDDAREFYGKQERVSAFNYVTQKHPNLFDWMASVEDYNVTKEEYLQSARDRAVSSYCLIKDGVWYEKGKMGWFGMSSDEMDEAQWNKFVNDTLDAVHPMTVITLIDFHI